MDLTVMRKGDGYRADWGDGPRPCAVGRGGIGLKTREGDGLTPIGIWPLRRVLYRADRMARPKTLLPSAPIAPDDGWCDAPDDQNYNRPVRLPYGASAETMTRADALYDVVVVVGFNEAPAVPGKGSAIFVHVGTADYAVTEGCVALSKGDLLEWLQTATPQDRLIVQAP